jgi:hypothetical protein
VSKRASRTPPEMKSERVVRTLLRRKEKTARSAGAFSIARTVRNAGCLGLGEHHRVESLE